MGKKKLVKKSFSIPTSPSSETRVIVRGKRLDSNYEPAAVYSLVDCSGSMGEGDKMLQAKRGTVEFASEAIRKGYSFGLICFASIAQHLCELCTDINHVKTAVGRMGASGGTNMTEAISLAHSQLKRIQGQRVICIITDGMPNSESSVERAIADIRKDGVDVMAIGTDDANWKFLSRLVSRHDLVREVRQDDFGEGIASMARLLPSNTKALPLNDQGKP